MKNSRHAVAILILLGLTCCSHSDDSNDLKKVQEEEQIQETTEGVAAVTDVTVSGEESQYTFNVTISSPDLGCQQYADWWEIIDLDGNLIYRRILAHSHINEQPFTRSGGPVPLIENAEVYIRAHMNTTSFGTKVFKGSVGNGFLAADLDNEFAQSLEEKEPLPENCAF